MRTLADPATTGLLLSGGIDSAVLLVQLLDQGWQVVPFYVRTGCSWESCELSAVEQFSAKVARPALADLVVLEMPLADLYGNHWSMTGIKVPGDTTADEAVYLPGRNPLLLLKPALWCRMHGIEHLALATLAGNPFRDATPAFFGGFEEMLREAMGGKLQISCPLEQMTKGRVMEMGRDLPLELTFSCLAPVNGMHCGQCNKCAERRRGFRNMGLEDRTRYFTTTEPQPSLSGPRHS
jgi:7-cyano-7-deazaguanine synthase